MSSFISSTNDDSRRFVLKLVNQVCSWSIVFVFNLLNNCPFSFWTVHRFVLKKSDLAGILKVKGSHGFMDDFEINDIMHEEALWLRTKKKLKKQCTLRKMSIPVSRCELQSLYFTCVHVYV
jgi:hypothetical protein